MAVSNIQINPLQYFKFSWTAAASDATNTTYTATIYQSQTDTVGVTQVTIPPNQIWKAVDINEYTTTTPDYSFDMIIGGTPQNINIDLNSTSLSLGTTRVNPFALMANGGMLIGSATTLKIQLASLAANGTVAQTLSARLGVAAYPIPSK
jgi:hypothetical protein